MSMSAKNVVAGLVLLLIGLAYGFLAMQLPERSVPNVPGPAFFPGVVATIIVILSLALLIKGLLGLRKESLTAKGGLSLSVWPILMLGWWLAFIMILPYAGFVLAAIPFYAGLMAMCDERRWAVITAGAIIIPVLLFYLFRDGLNILLPLGVWS